MDVIVERCAALDVHKRTVMACGRGPTAGAGGARSSGSSAPSPATSNGCVHGSSPRACTRWPWRPRACSGSPCGTCSKERPSSCCWPTHHVKNLPGRKTDASDAAWLAQLRDLTRYRAKVVAERAQEAQRLQKLLEDAGIKLD
jgi:hypothetical protein